MVLALFKILKWCNTKWWGEQKPIVYTLHCVTHGRSKLCHETEALCYLRCLGSAVFHLPMSEWLSVITILNACKTKNRVACLCCITSFDHMMAAVLQIFSYCFFDFFPPARKSIQINSTWNTKHLDWQNIPLKILDFVWEVTPKLIW